MPKATRSRGAVAVVPFLDGIVSRRRGSVMHRVSPNRWSRLAWCTVIGRTCVLPAAGLLALASPVAAAAPGTVPRLAVSALTADIVIDGRLDEAAWASAAKSEDLTQVDPREGAAASAATRVRVLAGPKAIVIGVEHFKANGRLDRRLRSDVHVLERQVAKLDRDVGLAQ